MSKIHNSLKTNPQMLISKFILVKSPVITPLLNFYFVFALLCILIIVFFSTLIDNV